MSTAHPTRIHFKTFGCKANSVDSDNLYFEAVRRGFEIVENEDDADAYVINSCTVTHAADRDARQLALKLKRRKPLSIVGIMGCYAQVAKEELLTLPEIDFIVGTGNKFKALDHIEAVQNAGEIARDQVESSAGFLPELFTGSRHSRASVKIQDGCNYRCSFCIIPRARGRSRSLPLSTVINQIDAAYAAGFPEVVLTGIHLAHYGWDQNTDLAALLRTIFERKNTPRIRLSSLDPFEIPEGLLELLRDEKRLCPHFHIALQSGSDTVLKRMRRLYKAQEFVDICQKIKAVNPDTFIGVDVISGFRGENEQEFSETLNCLQNSDWTKLHVFPFSVRAGTEAARLPDPVSAEVLTERSKILREMSDARLTNFIDSQIGKTKSLVLEKEIRPNLWSAHSENYLSTHVECTGGCTKQVVSATIHHREGDKALAVSNETKTRNRVDRAAPLAI